MFDTRGYLKLSPWEALIQIVNDEMYLQLNAQTTTLKSFTAFGGGMTEVVLATSRSSRETNILPVIPDVVVSYKRLFLQDFFRQTVAIELGGFKLPFSTRDLVEHISHQTGIVFDVDDFDHEYITSFPTNDLVLTASERSLRWVGSLVIRIVDTAQVNIGQAATVELPNAFVYPGSDITKTQAIHYTMRFDFTSFREYMHALKLPGQPITGERLASILTRVTGERWVCQDTPTVRNICTDVVQGVPQYRILYAGPATARYTARKDKNWVIVLGLDEQRCTDLTGALRLHFD
jgi:hypothetical protein